MISVSMQLTTTIYQQVEASCTRSISHGVLMANAEKNNESEPAEGTYKSNVTFGDKAGISSALTINS